TRVESKEYAYECINDLYRAAVNSMFLCKKVTPSRITLFKSWRESHSITSSVSSYQAGNQSSCKKNRNHIRAVTKGANGDAQVKNSQQGASHRFWSDCHWASGGI